MSFGRFIALGMMAGYVANATRECAHEERALLPKGMAWCRTCGALCVDDVWARAYVISLLAAIAESSKPPKPKELLP